MMPQLAGHASGARQCVFAEQDLERCRLQGERPQIKQRMVQGAKRQAIGLKVWPAVGMPFNMGSLQAGRHMAKAQVKATNAAAVFVGLQDAVTKRLVPTGLLADTVLGDMPLFIQMAAEAVAVGKCLLCKSEYY